MCFLQFWVLFSVASYDLSSIPYSLSVDNLSAYFSSCSLMMETGRRMFLILSHTLLKPPLYSKGAAEGEARVCVSPLIQIVQIPLFSTGSLCTPLGLSAFLKRVNDICLLFFLYKLSMRIQIQSLKTNDIYLPYM